MRDYTPAPSPYADIEAEYEVQRKRIRIRAKQEARIAELEQRIARLEATLNQFMAQGGQGVVLGTGVPFAVLAESMEEAADGLFADAMRNR